MAVKILLTLLTGVSFLGLCGLVKDRLRIDDSGAPLVASCGIIIALMLAGMVHALLWGWWALQIVGLAGFVWVFVVKKNRLSWVVLLAMLAGVIYVSIHFYGAYYRTIDSASHWALAAKYLLLENRFPDASVEIIYYPSYPLGTAVYIYYICRAIGMSAGAFLAAQTLLAWFSLLPILGFARKNRVVDYALAGILLVYLASMGSYRYSLQVDKLLAQMCLGGTFLIGQNQDQPRKAIWAALPVAVALVYIKSAGVFFSLVLCVCVALAPNGESRHGTGHLRRLLAALLVVMAAFALWQLHFKIAYRSGFIGVHSVTVSHYTQTLAEKPASLVWGTAVQILKHLPHSGPFVLCLAVCIGTFVLVAVLGKPCRDWLIKWKNTALFIGCILFSWYVCMFLTYVFSMSSEEAERLASFRRYEYSAVIYAVGVMLVFTFACWQKREFSGAEQRIQLCGALAVFCLVMFLPVSGTRPIDTLLSTKDGRDEYAFMLKMRDKNPNIEEGKRYIFFQHYNPELEEGMLKYRNITKLEFYSNKLMGVYHGQALIGEGGDSDFGYRLNVEYGKGKYGYIYDVPAFLAEHIDEYDYLLVYDYDEDFDAALKDFLKDYTGDTQVCYSY